MTAKHREIRRNLFDAPQEAASGNGRSASPVRRKARKKRPVEQAAPSGFESRRKIQLSRSHLFDFNHFSRILAFLLTRENNVKAPRTDLIENTGLPDGQVASLLSIGSGMGLIQPVLQTLTTTGALIAQRDLFFEDVGTLEWCHYQGAGNWRNFFWFEAFNQLLVHEQAMTPAEWRAYFKGRLQGEYAEQTIADHVPREVRFLLDLYTRLNFRKLDLLHFTPEGKVYLRRHAVGAPLVFCAMLHAFGEEQGVHLLQVDDLAESPGSPAVVFGLDAALLRQHIENLHDRGWLRYETTHNLDQVRLKPDLSSLELLTAYYERREPVRANKP